MINLIYFILSISVVFISFIYSPLDLEDYWILGGFFLFTYLVYTIDKEHENENNRNN